MQNISKTGQFPEQIRVNGSEWVHYNYGRMILAAYIQTLQIYIIISLYSIKNYIYYYIYQLQRNMAGINIQVNPKCIMYRYQFKNNLINYKNRKASIYNTSIYYMVSIEEYRWCGGGVWCLPNLYSSIDKSFKATQYNKRFNRLSGRHRNSPSISSRLL